VQTAVKKQVQEVQLVQVLLQAGALMLLSCLPAAGSGSSAHNESETIAKYEIMDGAPVRGENIPIRWGLQQQQQQQQAVRA
jgi:hypothetical protein